MNLAVQSSSDAADRSPRVQTGGRAVAQALSDNGVTDLFGVHGYINPVVEEACRLGIKMWHFRHEQAAGFAADAYARTLRRPAVCFASASAGMANYLSSLSQGIGALSPIVLLVGQHGTVGDRVETLQEGYAAEALRSVAKWTHRVVDWEMNAFWVRKALLDAMSYPPGPVVLEFPVNNLWGSGPQKQRKYVPGGGLPLPPQTQGDDDAVSRAAALLRGAHRPLLIGGDGVHWSDGADEFRALAEYLDAPATSRRTARGALPEDHRLAFTTVERRRLFDEADLICLVGMRAGELDSWFEPPDWPRGAAYIQISEVADEVWPGLPSEAVVVGSSRLVLRQLRAHLQADDAPQVDRSPWLATLEAARVKKVEKRAAIVEATAGRTPIHTFELAQAIAESVDPDATIIFDSYSGSLYLTDAVVARFPAQILDAGPRVALGQGVGMCLGAALARPGKQVVALVGDGGIGLSGMDVETLARYRMPALIVVLNNSSWGGNALMREELQPDIGSWDMMPNLRYDQVLAPLGAHGEHVEEAGELRPALERALAALADGRPAVLNVIADTDGTAVSAPWLRLKIGEFHSRGIDDLPASVRRHFQGLSPLETLRLHKSAADNGTHVSFAFLAELTGVEETVLREAAERYGYEV